MGEQQRRYTPKRNFRIRTKQYQMERWMEAENGEQLNGRIGEFKSMVGDRKTMI